MPAEAMRLRMIGEFDPQLLEHVVDWEIDLFRADDAGLELVDVEERVQHAQQTPAVLLSLATSFKALLLLSLIFFARIPRIRLIVCSGCRRSWLAAARKRDLPRLARSACHLAAFNAISARLRSVTSSIATTISQSPQVPCGSSRHSAAAPAGRAPATRSRSHNPRWRRPSAWSQIEKAAERRNIQATVADVSEVLADGFLRHDGEGAVKGAVGRMTRSLSSSTIKAWRIASMMRSAPECAPSHWHDAGPGIFGLVSMTFCRHTALLFLDPGSPSRIGKITTLCAVLWPQTRSTLSATGLGS